MGVYHFELDNDEGSGTVIDGESATIEQAWNSLFERYGDRLLSVCSKPNYSRCLKRGEYHAIQQQKETI